MHSSDWAVVGPSHPTTGAASLVQGVYGRRGNLELVACDPDDGLWVFWMNADLPDDPRDGGDVAPGDWSAGLCFAEGSRYTAVQILQIAPGPDHLEVLALDSDGVLQSWYWSPGPGFQRRSADAAVGVAAFAAVADATGRLTVDLVTATGTGIGAGTRTAVEAGIDGYPDRVWARAAPTPRVVPVPTAAATRELLALDIPAESIAPDTARTITTTRGHRTRELLYRDATGALRHRGIRLA